MICICAVMIFTLSSSSQSTTQRLTTALQQLQSDPQLRHAIIGLYIIDAKTGKKIFGYNEQTGLAPASTQKIFTSIATFEILGKNFQYKTELAHNGKINTGTLEGSLIIIANGDPTFGSWRWKSTHDTTILAKWTNALKKAGITTATKNPIFVNESKFTHQAIPDGWIWQDIGNYYGAGAYSLNWRENQYDLYLRSGSKTGDSVQLEEIVTDHYINELKSAPKNSGDNAYIYLGLGQHRNALVKGTIPINEKKFSISGASPDPVSEFITDFGLYLASHSIDVPPYHHGKRDFISHDKENLEIIDTHLSPSLDSMNYYFMRRSINLYGEAFIKTLAIEKNEPGDTEKGIDILRNFWSANGIEKSAFHIMDGSGLSPQNRVTAVAEVKALQYARTRPWFSSFYHSLPEYNGMKMKSGSIGGARAYAGYHTAKNGNEYIFSIIVNNYDGSASEVVKKMYKVLDILK